MAMRTCDARGKVETLRCPLCGEHRPFDWFGHYRFCWKCRMLHPEAAKVAWTEEDERRVRREKREAVA